jgi:hypothetical protein
MHQSFIAIYYTHIIYKSYEKKNLKDTSKQNIKLTQLSYKHKKRLEFSYKNKY